MAIADTARLIASLDLKGNFNAQLRASEKALGGFESRLDRTQSRAYKFGGQIGTGIKNGAVLAAGAIGFLATNVGLGLKSLTELESITTQTNAVLKSTKAVSGETADSIRKLAEQYESLNATIDDKVIQSGENLLLTFTNIRKDAFEPALKAALDMNQALGRGESGLQGTVQQLGKALNDPIKGLTALQRVGITFTKTQKDEIKAAVDAGDTFKAQSVILDELNKRFGGSFLAGGSTTAGKVAKFKDAIEDLQKALAQALLPTIGKVADALTKFLADPKVVSEVGKLGEKIASLFSDKNLAEGGKFLQDAFNTAKQAAPIIEASARATFGIVQAAVGLFKSLPEGLQQLAVGAFAINKLTGGLVTNVAGGIFDTLKDFFIKQRGSTPANPLFVADVAGALGGLGGALGGAGAAGAGAGLFGGAGLPLAVIGASIIGPLLAQQKISSDNTDLAKSVGAAVNSQIAGGATLKDLQTSLAAVNTGIDQLQSNPLYVLVQGDALDQLKAQRKTLETALYFQTHPVAVGNATPKTFIGSAQFPGKEKDDTAIVVATLKLISNEFKNVANTLKTSNKASEIKNAISEAMKLIGAGRGDAGNTSNILAGLKRALKNTHDPELQRQLRAAIAKVEHVLPGRQFAAKQLAQADRILRSNEKSGRKIDDLKAIERALKDRGLPHAADRIREKIDQAKREQVYAARAATQAIKDKDLSVNVKVPVTTNVTVRSIINGTTLVSSLSHTLSTKGGFVIS